MMSDRLRLSVLPRLRQSARLGATLGLVAASFASAAFASSSVSVAPNPQAGNILVDDHGMTLYRFTPDQPNQSTCYDACASAWPPMVVDAVPTVADPTLAAGLGVAPRTDGSQQLTYQGQPLYYFVDDTQAGDTNGQGSGGAWFVVQVQP